MRKIYTLMERGSYTDATILLRTLVESFIYYKHYILNNDGVGLSKYVLRETPLKSDINNINLDWFSYVSNQLEPLFIGVIRLYKIVFPNNTIEKDKDLMIDIEVIYQFVEKDILYRKVLYPAQLSMLEYYNKIIEVNCQNN